MNLLVSITAIALALGTVEGVAYWWMRPISAGQGEPVLVYRPGSGSFEPGIGMERSDMDRSDSRRAPQEDRQGTGSNQGSEIEDRGSETRSDRQAVTPSFPSDEQSTIASQQSSFSPSSIQNSKSNIQNSFSPSPSLTPLPEIYATSAPMLRCSGGQVLHARLDDSSGIHLAFFEWDGTDTGSVLEAFRHMPEACMGSIGMKLVEKAPVRTFVVGGTEDRLSVVGCQLSEKELSGQSQSPAPKRTASNDNRQPTTDNSSTLVFDHTVFREGGGLTGLGAPIHAFRAVWISGVSAADARKGLRGDEFDRLRTIRLKSAIDRFRPAHARVIQGAVRGIADPDLAWQAFESAMLKDLSFQSWEAATVWKR